MQKFSCLLLLPAVLLGFPKTYLLNLSFAMFEVQLVVHREGAAGLPRACVADSLRVNTSRICPELGAAWRSVVKVMTV